MLLGQIFIMELMPLLILSAAIPQYLMEDMTFVTASASANIIPAISSTTHGLPSSGAMSIAIDILTTLIANNAISSGTTTSESTIPNITLISAIINTTSTPIKGFPSVTESSRGMPSMTNMSDKSSTAALSSSSYSSATYSAMITSSTNTVSMTTSTCQIAWASTVSRSSMCTSTSRSTPVSTGQNNMGSSGTASASTIVELSSEYLNTKASMTTVISSSPSKSPSTTGLLAPPSTRTATSISKAVTMTATNMGTTKSPAPTTTNTDGASASRSNGIVSSSSPTNQMLNSFTTTAYINTVTSTTATSETANVSSAANTYKIASPSSTKAPVTLNTGFGTLSSVMSSSDTIYSSTTRTKLDSPSTRTQPVTAAATSISTSRIPISISWSNSSVLSMSIYPSAAYWSATPTDSATTSTSPVMKNPSTFMSYPSGPANSSSTIEVSISTSTSSAAATPIASSESVSSTVWLSTIPKPSTTQLAIATSSPSTTTKSSELITTTMPTTSRTSTNISLTPVSTTPKYSPTNSTNSSNIHLLSQRYNTTGQQITHHVEIPTDGAWHCMSSLACNTTDTTSPVYPINGTNSICSTDKITAVSVSHNINCGVHTIDSDNPIIRVNATNSPRWYGRAAVIAMICCGTCENTVNVTLALSC